MEISKELIEFIKKKEGFRATAYKDGNGYSIGYGHWKPNPKQKIEIDTDTGTNENTWYDDNTTIDEKCAEDYLLQDIRKVIADIGRVYPSFISLDQGKKDALTSLVYNWGLAPFTRSKLFKYLKQHDYKSASHEFLDINKSGGKILAGLTKRRQEEADIFLYGW
jgi:lysozyme